MKIQVLDHGYVELIEPWGHGRDGMFAKEVSLTGQIREVDLEPDYEVGIIEAARQSTQGSFRGWDPAPCDCQADVVPVPHTSSCASKLNPGDARLLKFLHNNRHATPFEFSGMVLEVQAPIFVFREWHRHRTQSYNEMSARYAPLPDLYYMPTRARVLDISSTNKQAGAVTPSMKDFAQAQDWLARLGEQYEACESLYQRSLQMGVPKELARLVMPVGHYSRMRASANLRNWLAFLTLRMDPNAQWEIRQFAKAVGEIIAAKFPRTWSLFNEQANERPPGS